MTQKGSDRMGSDVEERTKYRGAMQGQKKRRKLYEKNQIKK